MIPDAVFQKFLHTSPARCYRKRYTNIMHTHVYIYCIFYTKWIATLYFDQSCKVRVNTSHVVPAATRCANGWLCPRGRQLAPPVP